MDWKQPYTIITTSFVLQTHIVVFTFATVYFSRLPSHFFLKISLFLYHTLSSLVTGRLNEWNVSCCDKQRESVLPVPQQTAVHVEDHTDFKHYEGLGRRGGGQWVNWKLTVLLYRTQSSQSRN